MAKELVRTPHQVVVTQHHALWITRRPASVDQVAAHSWLLLVHLLVYQVVADI